MHIHMLLYLGVLCSLALFTAAMLGVLDFPLDLVLSLWSMFSAMSEANGNKAVAA